MSPDTPETPQERKLTVREMSAIRMRAQAYVVKQLMTMAKFGPAPTLTPERYSKLVDDCAKPLIEIARWSLQGLPPERKD